MNRICPHWIPEHRGSIDDITDAEFLRRWDPAWLKVIIQGYELKLPYIEDYPPNARIDCRHYPDSEMLSWGGRGLNTADKVKLVAKNQAEHHAAIADQAQTRGLARDKIWFEGLNEPMYWANEPESAIADLECLRTDYAHGYGCQVIVDNSGVGWRANRGTGTPPYYGGLLPILAVMHPTDYVGVHEYWSREGPGTMWGWWAGRATKCPYPTKFLVTECGIDQAVIPGEPHAGWLTLPGTMEQKVATFGAQLAWYAEQLRLDGRFDAIMIFTHDSGKGREGAANDWENFNTRQRPFMDYIANHQTTWPDARPILPLPVAPPPSADPVATVRSAIWNAARVPYNANAAFAKFARATKLGPPLTPETDIGAYRAQGFVEAIIYAKIGHWDEISVIPW